LSPILGIALERLTGSAVHEEHVDDADDPVLDGLGERERDLALELVSRELRDELEWSERYGLPPWTGGLGMSRDGNAARPAVPSTYVG
jgi:hypothetical protein